MVLQSSLKRKNKRLKGVKEMTHPGLIKASSRISSDLHATITKTKEESDEDEFATAIPSNSLRKVDKIRL